MKIFKSEIGNNYSNYTFGYSEYAILESPEDISPIYSNGYLPYSADLALDYKVFYLARSLRVDTNLFTDTSENRRVAKKMSDLTIEIIKHKILDFDLSDEAFINFCLKYAKARFSNDAMDEKRLKYVLNAGIATDIFEFRNINSDEILGYVLSVANDNLLHYWFSFYNYELLEQYPLGKWMMWRMIHWSKDNNIKHIYLGTAYGTKAMYKVRDFKGLEYYTGSGWSDDVKKLKSLCANDTSLDISDSFKNSTNKNEYISRKTMIFFG